MGAARPGGRMNGAEGGEGGLPTAQPGLCPGLTSVMAGAGVASSWPCGLPGRHLRLQVCLAGGRACTEVGAALSLRMLVAEPGARGQGHLPLGRWWCVTFALNGLGLGLGFPEEGKVPGVHR